MLADDILVNYHDAVVYRSDASLTAPGKWLNDRIIYWYFKYLELGSISKEIAGGTFPTDILLMDPSVVSFMRIQCEDEDDFASLARGQRIASRRLVLMPCSDSTNFESASTHWSLVVVDLLLHTACHMDSSAGMNRKSARHLVQKFEKLMRSLPGEASSTAYELTYRDLPTPQQDNGSDCGVFVLLCAETIVRTYASKSRNIDSIEGGGGDGISPSSASFSIDVWYDEGAVASSVGPAQARVCREAMRARLVELSS